MREDYILFSESNSRFIIEVEPDKAPRITKMMRGLPFAWIGETTDSDRLVVRGAKGVLADERLADLKEAWQKPLRTV
jgi:phosphoribosylformylglycinamidine synthase